MRFVALDVETANPNMSSICQIGLVQFEEGREVRSESILVDPQTWFDPYNVGVHRIDEVTVRDAPNFQTVHEQLHAWTADQVVVCHTHFDRVALHQACSSGAKPTLACRWLDSARVARRTWPQFAQRGYGLANVAAFCGIQFKHHDALEDARAAGLVVMHATVETGHDLAAWFALLSRGSSAGPAIKRAGDGDGALVGETIVFTGALEIPRRDAADLAARAGANVAPGVTKSTTMLVVGDQDISRLNGQDKSSKHTKVEALIGQGQSIRILGETDFMALSAITD